MIELRLPSRQGLVQRYFPNGRLGGLMIDGAPPVPVGTAVRLKVCFEDPPRAFDVRCRIAWARFAGSESLKPAFGLEFLPTEATARDRLIAFATGDSPVESLRAAERIEVSLRARIAVDGVTVSEQATDVSPGGLFAATPRLPPPPVGTPVNVTLRPPLSLRSVALAGRIAWRREHGEGRGVGIEFQFRDLRERSRIDSLIRRVQKRRRTSNG